MIRYIFSLEGTVVSQGLSSYIAKHFNVEDTIEKLTKEAAIGNIPYVESFIKRVHKMSDLPVDEINFLLENASLYADLVGFINTHKEQCVVVTGNLDCWVEKLCKKIGCDYYTSTAIVIDNKVDKIESILRKERIVNKYQEKGDAVVFVGQGNDDFEAMRQADISIASGLNFSPSNSVLGITDYVVFKEETLCRQLNQLL